MGIRRRLGQQSCPRGFLDLSGASPYDGHVTRLLLAGLLLALLWTPARAQPGPRGGGEQQGAGPDAEQLLKEAENYYVALEYEASLKTLIAVLQTPGATPMQKARAFLYMGVCFTALGNAQNAVAAFSELLKIKPGFRLTPDMDISPSIRAMFKEALKRMKLPENPSAEGHGGERGPEGGVDKGGDTGVSVEANVHGSPKAGEAVDVNIELTDPKKLVQEIVLHWRLVGGPDFSVIRVKFKPGQSKAVGRIPGAVLGTLGGRLQYVVEALGRGGLTLAHAGTHSSPLEAELEAPPKSRSKWGWWALGIGGGSAVVGGIVAAILLTRGSSPPPTPTTATVSVTVK